jgi:hypothetical protein
MGGMTKAIPPTDQAENHSRGDREPGKEKYEIGTLGS